MTLEAMTGAGRIWMETTAIISDIHANLEALEAVLADIDQQGIREIICLGDIVGYGPDPAECIDRVKERCRLTIRGNHDEALLRGPIGFTPIAREAMEWTRKVLRPRFWKPAARARWKYIESLPLQADWEEFLLVHGSPRDPTSEYIMDRDVLFGNNQKFIEIFARVQKVCFAGHTHIAGVFYDGPRWVRQSEIHGSFRYDGVKMIINVGSVGQPRDRDPRACYLTVNGQDRSFRYHRVPYNWEATREKIHRIPELNSQLGDRLLEGI